MTELLQCPNCNAIWGMSEIDFQQCDCCGYPQDGFDDEDTGDDDYWPEDESPDDDIELPYEQIS